MSVVWTKWSAYDQVLSGSCSLRVRGAHRLLVPVEVPRPHVCAHCYLPADRRELRRFMIDGPLPTALGNEAWVG